jgi:hypothetical protein
MALIAALAFAALLPACKPDAPEPEEEITTVNLKFTAGASTVTFSFKEGSNPDTIKLSPSASYTLDLEFLNENETPAEDVTEEIRTENDEHLICFEVVAGNVTITRTDKDANNLEVGLKSTWQTGAASTGSVIVELRHQPDGLKNGTCAPGDTDVEVTFPVRIQ